MSLCLKGQKFVRTIGIVQYSILQLKHNILSDIHNPILMNDIDASLQNTILRCLYAVYNMIKTMCHKVSIPIHLQFHHYVYNSPIRIKDRPQLIHSFACSSIYLLHELRNSFIDHDKQLPRLAQAHTHTNRVHFYLYLLDKITLCIGFVTKRLDMYELL